MVVVGGWWWRWLGGGGGGGGNGGRVGVGGRGRWTPYFLLNVVTLIYHNLKVTTVTRLVCILTSCVSLPGCVFVFDSRHKKDHKIDRWYGTVITFHGLHGYEDAIESQYKEYNNMKKHTARTIVL